jgi:hypothetical protein
MRFLVVFGSGTGTNTNGISRSCAGSSVGGSITTSSVSSMVIGHPNATDQNRASARIGSTHGKMHDTSRHLPDCRRPVGFRQPQTVNQVDSLTLDPPRRAAGRASHVVFGY